jgi:SP family general alpha glucoside:H+ symporter-like MFS transporter
VDSADLFSAIIMEGYDTLLLGQFFANQAFAKRFGSYSPEGDKYEIAARWQTGLGVSARCVNLTVQPVFLQSHRSQNFELMML